MTHFSYQLTLAALVVLSLLAVPLVSADMPGQTSITTIDADHPLASNESIATFESEGVVSARLQRLDLRLTIADDAGDVGLSEFRHTSSLNTYVRLDYDEEIARTIRLYLPAEYAEPYTKEGLEAVDADVTANLAPVDDRQYVALTVRVDGPTNATFALNHAPGAVLSAREWVSDLVNKTTGISLPSFAIGPDDAEWQYVPESALAGDNTTYILPTNETNRDNLTIQYDSDPNAGEQNERWLPVQSCDGDQSVCLLQKDGSDSLQLLSTAADPPVVRYREGKPGLFGGASSIVADVQHAIDGFLTDAKSVLPWTNSGDGGA